MVASVNICELGFPALAHDLTWVTCCILRTSMIQKTLGGWPRCMRTLLHMLLTEPLAVGLAGIPLTLHGAPFLLYGKVSAILTDLDGHRQTFDWNGTSSMRPCCVCRNLWRKGYGTGPGQVTICCEDTTQFEPLTSGLLCDMLDLLAEGHRQRELGAITAKKLKDMTQAFGFHFNQHSWLCDGQLRELLDIPSLVRVDWMHCELQNGAFAVDCSLFIQECKNHGITLDCWAELMRAAWQFPKRHMVRLSGLPEIFNKYGAEYAEKKKQVEVQSC